MPSVADLPPERDGILRSLPDGDEPAIGKL
jgi:hypothetical protein